MAFADFGFQDRTFKRNGRDLACSFFADGRGAEAKIGLPALTSAFFDSVVNDL
jgi:hypothetical protein